MSDIILVKMRFNLALAVFVSLFLVGGASWSRFAPSDERETDLIAVETKRQSDEEYYNQVVLPVLEKSATSSIATAEPLTGTDLLGRQLIVDYIEMASRGEVSEEAVLALAERYVESIPTLSNTPTVPYSELSLANNESASFQRYADTFIPIYKQYVSRLKIAGQDIALEEGGVEGYASFAKEAAPIYKDTARKLTSLKVPGQLAQSHLGLINVYLSSGESFEAIAQTEHDSASAFAGLLAISENSDKERKLLLEIESILNSHGI